MSYDFDTMGPDELRTALNGPTGDIFLRQIADAALTLAEKTQATNVMVLAALEKTPPTLPGTFGWVLEGLRAGKRYARPGWNGKGMFIFLVGSSVFTVNREPLASILEPGSSVNYHAHIDLMTGDNNVAVWVPSVVDLFAADWEEV